MSRESCECRRASGCQFVHSREGLGRLDRVSRTWVKPSRLHTASGVAKVIRTDKRGATTRMHFGSRARSLTLPSSTDPQLEAAFRCAHFPSGTATALHAAGIHAALASSANASTKGMNESSFRTIFPSFSEGAPG